MNGVEQEQRHARLRTIEKRVEDLETVLQALASEIVNDRRTIATHLQVFNERLDAADRLQVTTCQERWDAASDNHMRLGRAHAAFVGMTFVQRLRWIVGV